MSDQTPTDQHANVVIRPPVLWLLLLVAGVVLDRFAPWPFLPVGFPAIWTGVVVWLVGFVLAAMAIWQFQRAGTGVDTHTSTRAIVETGVFAYSRNPIYVGAHIGLLGAAIALDSIWVVLMLVPFFLVIRYGVVAREEAYLERRFKDDYLDYKARVRRWF